VTAEVAAVFADPAAALHVVAILATTAVFAAEVALGAGGALADIAVFAAFFALQGG
jgi:hypothetical protein